MRNSVELVVDENLCIGCGICKSVCPFECIISKKNSCGINVPFVDKNSCINCGKCLQHCPGKGFDYNCLGCEFEKNDNSYLGKIDNLYNVQTKNREFLMVSTSGGFVSTLISILLDEQEYESAFLVDSNSEKDGMECKRYVRIDSMSKIFKSRYVPVSHSETIKYILEHKNERVILVGTSCFIESFVGFCDSYALDRNNYLLIGLFCDKVMTFNVMDYYSNFRYKKAEIKEILFRTKEMRGWPGDLKITYLDGKVLKLPAVERMAVKECFMPERCLYCIDKLNIFADISVGDNYTNKNQSKSGSNSIIVRTDIGKNIWCKYKNYFLSSPITIRDIWIAQKMDEKRNNYVFLQLKGSSIIIPPFSDEPYITQEIIELYSNKMSLLALGENKEYDKITDVVNDIKGNLVSNLKRNIKFFVQSMLFDWNRIM